MRSVNRSLVLGLASIGGSTTLLTVLLARMRGEFQRHGRLEPATVAMMYAAYAAHAGAVVVAARRRMLPLPWPTVPASAAGYGLAVGGAVLTLAGMGRFSPQQLSGTEVGQLVTGGVYRYSRNPQYTGYVLVLAGLGLARRSAAVLALASMVAGAFRAWVPVEERHLERELGQRYSDYRARAPRWLGRTRQSG